jgi:hypothetical protein
MKQTITANKFALFFLVFAIVAALYVQQGVTPIYAEIL